MIDVEIFQETQNAKNSEEFTDRYPTTTNKKRVSHVTESNTSQVYRKPVPAKKHIPTPAEVRLLE